MYFRLRICTLALQHCDTSPAALLQEARRRKALERADVEKEKATGEKAKRGKTT